MERSKETHLRHHRGFSLCCELGLEAIEYALLAAMLAAVLAAGFPRVTQAIAATYDTITTALGG